MRTHKMRIIYTCRASAIRKSNSVFFFFNSFRRLNDAIRTQRTERASGRTLLQTVSISRPPPFSVMTSLLWLSSISIIILVFFFFLFIYPFAQKSFYSIWTSSADDNGLLYFNWKSYFNRTVRVRPRTVLNGGENTILMKKTRFLVSAITV